VKSRRCRSSSGREVAEMDECEFSTRMKTPVLFVVPHRVLRVDAQGFAVMVLRKGVLLLPKINGT
jgi:hypothetical protein